MALEIHGSRGVATPQSQFNGMPKVLYPGSTTSNGSGNVELLSAELFVGAGGLALGVHQAGFSQRILVEMNHDACATLRYNYRNLGLPAPSIVKQDDARNIDITSLHGKLDLLCGGPPCQPFSVGGLHGGTSDRRNLFPVMVQAVRDGRPATVLIENVSGLSRPKFAGYLDYLRLQLTLPELQRLENEHPQDHSLRLSHEVQTSSLALKYRVSVHKVNAADFGVPQKRQRLLIIAWREDVKYDWHIPQPDHSLEALLWDQWVTGAYWDKHRVPAPKRPGVPKKFVAKVRQLRHGAIKPTRYPWRTVRDEIWNLPQLAIGEKYHEDQNHYYRPGARIYKGHSGSVMDEPAKTLKAGVHGVPGGENTLRIDVSTVRYFSVREAARLQTFPDTFVFHGAWSEAMRQVGNAVPVRLGEVFASSIAKALDSSTVEPPSAQKPVGTTPHWAVQTDHEPVSSHSGPP